MQELPRLKARDRLGWLELDAVDPLAVIDHAQHRAADLADDSHEWPSPLHGCGHAGAGPRRSLIVAGHEACEGFDHVVHAGVVEARIDADEERRCMITSVVRQVADHAALDALERRVPQQVAAEQAARLDAIGLEEPGQVSSRVNPASSRTVITNPNHDGIGVRRRDRQEQAILERAERLEQPSVIVLPRGDEVVESLELGAADGRLHVGGLQVVAEVAVDVLVVVAVRQAAELLAKRLPQVLFSPPAQ